MKPNTIDTGEYRVTTDKVELPKGTYFYCWPAKVEDGQLALISIGDGDFQLVGRYYHTLADSDWITVPGYLIRVTGAVPVRVVGAVIPSEAPPKQITNLPESEWGHLFENPFPRSMAC